MSWDGQAYHQPMVYALAYGWNPIEDSHNTIIDDIWNMNIWIDHYLRGMEISAATIVSFTNNLEMGKAVNMIFMLSVLTESLHLLTASTFNLSRKKAVLYSSLLAFPIVFVNYGFTFYIDIATYYLVFWVLALLYQYTLLKKRKFWEMLFVVIFLAATIKLNTFFWICYILFFYCIYLLYQNKIRLFRNIVAIGSLAILFGVATTDFNPIITNTLDHHNPFYPIGTKEANDIGVNAQPNLIKDKNRLAQVAISIFSRPNDNMETPYLNPYRITYNYNIRSLGFGAKLGGGGMFFIEIFVISILLVGICLYAKFNKTVFNIILLFLLALFILPYGSNYRYVPFISILPIFLLLYTEIVGFKYSCLYKIRSVCLFLLCTNVIISIPFFFRNTCLSAKSQKEAIEFVRNTTLKEPYHSKNWSFNYKLNGNNIPDRQIFSNNNENYEPLPNQFGPPIYIHK